MALTAKPITSITYNSVPFLTDKLNALVETGRLEEYRFIEHYKDTDPNTGEVKKAHIHMWLLPNRRLDTAMLRKEFNEIDPSNTLPLRPQPFEKCNSEGDWLLYVLHDPEYLELKGLAGQGKEPYELDEVKCTDRDLLEQVYREAKADMMGHLSKEEQRNIISEYIMSRTDHITLQSVYEHALRNNLVDGYQSAYRMLADIIREHNESVERVNNQQEAIEQKAIALSRNMVREHTKELDKALKMAEIGPVTTTLTDSHGREKTYTITKASTGSLEAVREPKHKQENESLWDGLDVYTGRYKAQEGNE